MKSRVLCIALLAVFLAAGAGRAWAGPPAAVPTFECVGLYWSPGSGADGVECTAHYRAKGDREWREALPLWFDARNREYRGSIVHLQPGTEYEIRLALKGTQTAETLVTRTWREQFPITRTVRLPAASSQTYVVEKGGTPEGYVLYTTPADSPAVIDVNNGSDCCLRVKASYVIIRGLTLKGARVDGIRIDSGVHDVVIERCDISGWGRVRDDGWGFDYDAGIRAGNWRENDLRRLIIQRNRIHDPRSNSNDWSQTREFAKSNHPQGPQGIVWFDTPGNHVIRYNEVTSDEQHRFNDGMGGGTNFGLVGFPGPDSDVYGNVVTNVCDDALEMEGGGCNVRVWGNYLDQTFVGIAVTAVTRGPIYLFRNVLGMTRTHETPGGGVLGKLGDKPPGPGRQYWFHNTALPGGTKHGLTSYGGPYTRCVSYNNILSNILNKGDNPDNVFDYDVVYGARVPPNPGVEAHGSKERPIFAAGHGGINRAGRYALAPASPGYDKGVRIPNFNDGFQGAGPDVGAHEAGTPPMEFGVDAHLTGKPAARIDGSGVENHQ